MGSEGIIFVQDFPRYLAEELIKRQEIMKRANIGKNLTDAELLSPKNYDLYKTEDLEFLLGKISWIRMTSNAVPRPWPPTKLDVVGNEYIIPNWENDGKDGEGNTKYSWRPEDDPRTITKYDIRKETVLYGGNMIFKKGENGTDNFMMPRAGFNEIYGPRTYGVLENYEMGADDDFSKAKYSNIGGVYTNENRQFKPAPGITGISVSLGTQFIRKATIKWNCFSWDDFEVFERLYLTPGISVFLEWGWTTIDKILPIMDFSYDYKKPRDYFKKLMNAIVQSKGRYDGMVGVINNFSWSTSGGTIECTTDIMSPATLLAASSIVNPELKSGNKTLKDFVNDLETEKTGESIILSTDLAKLRKLNLDDNKIKIYKYTYGKSDDKNTPERYITWEDFEKILTVYSAPASITSEELPDENGTVKKTDDKKKEPSDTEAKQDIKKKSHTKDETSTTTEKSGDVVDETKDNIKDDGNLFLIRSADFGINKDTDKTKYKSVKTIGNNLFLSSCDPQICLLPDQVFLSNNIWKNQDSTDITSATPKLQSQVTPKAFYDNDQLTNSDIINSKQLGVLNNILLNVKFIKESLEGVDTLKDYLQNKIYKGVSEACGNIFKFSFVQSIYDPFIMQTNDDFACASQTTAMFFKARGSDSIIKSLSITGEIPQAMGSRLWILANSPDESDPKNDKAIFSRDGYVDGFLGTMKKVPAKPTKEEWNKLDATQKEKIAKNSDSPDVKTYAKQYEPTEEEKKKQETEDEEKKKQSSGTSSSSGSSGSSGTTEKKEAKESTQDESGEVEASGEEEEDKNLPLHRVLENKIIRYYQALRFVYEAYDQKYIDTAKARLAQLVNMSEKLMMASTFDSRLLPVKLNLVIDGISGIQYGHAITTNLLPQRYFPNVTFRVINVSSEVNSSGWTTALETMMQIAPSTYKLWMKQEKVDGTSTIEPYPIKNYESFTKMLDKLNYTRVREGILKKDIKIVKLKVPKEPTKDGSTGTGTGSGTTPKKVIPVSATFNPPKNSILEYARMSIGEDGYAKVDFKVTDTAYVKWYGNNKGSTFALNKGTFSLTTSSTGAWNYNMYGTGQKEGENSFRLEVSNTGTTAKINAVWDVVLNFKISNAAIKNDPTKFSKISSNKTPVGTNEKVNISGK